MTINIVAVGKIKDKFYVDAVGEYTKRLSRFATVNVIEVPECTFEGNPNEKQVQEILLKEGQSLSAKIKGCLIAMDIEGKLLDSVQFSNFIKESKQNYSTFTFVIGGSYGLSKAIKDSAQLRFSLGKITLPHQLARVVLTEQIYRAITIDNNITYHK